ncbi:hypothetical protein PENVUL_c021G07536 [Penicillium vulpinum]|uniref:C2H2-type domain-containing protein n=1 Tax=Penicillium vulpinum TaxID=29845 RepID=A0A1V6RVM9_9EURO|nr:hypothetical protein PENVUL_c021G07536 [Penicillium vulpinum]
MDLSSAIHHMYNSGGFMNVIIMPPPSPDHAQSKRRYPCPMCSKSFTRSEHRIRHERSHTLEKPFSCRYCRRKYARRDLVLRHEKTIHKDEYTKGACRRKKNVPSAIDPITDPALGTDDIVEGSPSSSSPEITSPPQPASSNQSHCGILTAPPAALPTPQPCLDTILIDELTSIGGQNDQRETSQQFLPDTSTAAKEYDMFEKTLQASELNPSQPWSAIPGCELSEAQDETGPYWALFGISPPFDITGGFDRRP